jgi:hypothetical protein
VRKSKKMAQEGETAERSVKKTKNFCAFFFVLLKLQELADEMPVSH